MSRDLIVVDGTCEWCSSPTVGNRRFCGRPCSARFVAQNRTVNFSALREAAANRRRYDGEENPNFRGGRSRHPLIHTYYDMVARCTRRTHHAYARYGGRGIDVCEQWRQNFWTFVADMGERPKGLSLDRIDNDGPYSPDNCRWATPSQQSANRRVSAYAGSRRDELGRFS